MVAVAEGQIPKIEPARFFFCKRHVLLSLPRVPNNLPSAFDIPAEREQNPLLISGLV
jgi:hypothetical protein